MKFNFYIIPIDLFKTKILLFYLHDFIDKLINIRYN